MRRPPSAMTSGDHFYCDSDLISSRVKIHSLTVGKNFDRAPYRKNACVFESRFPIHALRAVLVHISAAPDNALTIPTGATGIPTAAQNVMIQAWETEDSDGSCVAFNTFLI